MMESRIRETEKAWQEGIKSSVILNKQALP